MPDGDRLLPSAAVLRIPPLTLVAAHVSGTQRKPLPAAFALSPPERALHATGRRVLISAWDRAKISLAGALAQRNARGEVAAFALSVAKVDAIANDLAHPDLRVVEDPTGAPPEASPEVREAHAGIGGLDEDPVGHPNRKLRNDARVALALACDLAEDL